jgi:exonuclease III
VEGWKKVSMKILSYNVRGLGCGEKRVEIRRLVNAQRPSVLCIQETKLTVVNDQVVKAVWGDSPCGFSFQSSIGASGGLLTVWDSDSVNVWSSMSFGHVLVIKGTDITSAEDFVIINVYAPCVLAAKNLLWDRLLPIVLNNSNECLCVCGDFNSVCGREERKGRGVVFRQADADYFNKFIVDGLLIDLPITGCLFTWFKGDGVSMSRLDRFLISNKWCQKWPNCIQLALQKGLSDHVPLMLYVDDVNWGPRPFRMLKCWSDFPGYREFVREKWGSFSCQGWSSYVLQQKFKMLKNCLKDWHYQHSQNLESKILEVKNKIAVLDSKGEVSVLHGEEVSELHDLSVKLHSLARTQSSINWQMSRMNWLQEGDANSKYFHGFLSGRRRHNSINVVSVDGARVEGVHNIRAAIFNYFSNHYKSIATRRPGVDGLMFRQLSSGEAGNLTKPFTMEEIKQAVWDCDSYKSPGPDGISFGFIKEFWDILKEDFLRFMVDFHRNGKLTKGLNSTFIALIPKVNSPQRLRFPAYFVSQMLI